MTKYLDNGGLQRFFDNLTGKFQTISQVNTLIEESASESLSNPEIVSIFIIPTKPHTFTVWGSRQ